MFKQNNAPSSFGKKQIVVKIPKAYLPLIWGHHIIIISCGEAKRGGTPNKETYNTPYSLKGWAMEEIRFMLGDLVQKEGKAPKKSTR